MKKTVLAAVSALALAVPAYAQNPEAAVERLEDYLDAFPDLGPGYAAVVVTADEVLMRRVEGVRRVSTGAPMTADTPQYIASQTKAFMGLLAARLDAEGILDLDSHITDHWPEMEFPGWADPSEYTLRDLLSHQVPFIAQRITAMETTVMPVAAADYPRMLVEHGYSRDPGYQYDNLGYNIYAAILETATGRSWKDWLDLHVFEPLDMDHTSSRTSDFPPEDLAWRHIWRGEEEGWYEMPPKTDGIMQSAGGLVTSANDMATWLQLQVRGEGPAGSGITADMLATAQTGYAEANMAAGNSPIGAPCPQYALGWWTCDMDGHEVYQHGGAFPGARSIMAFSPDLGVGIAFFFNTDNQTNWLSGDLVRLYFEYLLDSPGAADMGQRLIEQYPGRVSATLENSRNAMAERLAAEHWQGWNWSPDRETLARYTGVYTVNDDPYHTMDVRLEGDGLIFHWGEFNAEMRPAVENRFGVQLQPFSDIFPADFTRNEAGEITGFGFLGIQFERRMAH